MQTIDLDLSGCYDRKTLHAHLKRGLDLPPYYGGNLDALHSELISFTEQTHIRLRYALDDGIFSDYIRRLLQVFEDAAEENPRLTVEFLRPPSGGQG